MSSPPSPQHLACGSSQGVSRRLLKQSGQNVPPAPMPASAFAPMSLGPVGNGTLSCAGSSLIVGFSPSPCPAHYGRRLATIPSADFCWLTAAGASDLASRLCPCLSLVVSVKLLFNGDLPIGDFHPVSSCPCWAYTKASTRTRASPSTVRR